jgi:hypothetical protein
MIEITNEQLENEKKNLFAALNTISLDEVAIQHTLKGYRRTSVVNAIFLVVFFLTTFLYPLITPVNPLHYIVLWAASISIFVLRIKLYLKITPKELELVGLLNLKLIYEGELEKIRKIEYDRLTGQRSPKELSPTVSDNGEPTARSGEDAGSPEEKSSTSARRPGEDEGGGSPAA